MFGRISQAIRNFTTNATNEIPKPFGYERIGSNLPFDIHNVNALTVKFILFFSSAFYIPFLAVHVQTQRFFEGHKVKEQPKESTEIYGLAQDEQDKKKPEIYL